MWKLWLIPIDGAPASLFDPIVFVVIALKDKWVVDVSPLLSNFKLGLLLGCVEALLSVAHHCCPVYSWYSMVFLRRLLTFAKTKHQIACVDAWKELNSTQRGILPSPARTLFSRASSHLPLLFNWVSLGMAFHLEIHIAVLEGWAEILFQFWFIIDQVIILIL